MNRVKKYLSILLAFVLIVSSLAVGGNIAFASNSVLIYSDAVEAKADTTISVPIYMENNNGIAGWELQFKYDSKILTPISVKSGEVFENGILEDSGTLQDSIGGSATPGEFIVKYFHL